MSTSRPSTFTDGAIINERTSPLPALRDRATAGLRSLAQTPKAAPVRRELWARRIARAGVVDRRYYEIQTGQTFSSDEAAARHLMSRTRGEDFSLNPLFEPEWLLAGLSTPAEKLGVAYLLDDAAGTSCGPVDDRFPVGAEGPLSQLRSLQTDDSTAAIRAAVVENARRFAEERAWLAPVGAKRSTATDPAIAGPRAVTVVIPTSLEASDLTERLSDLAAQTHGDWKAVVVGDVDSARDVVAGSGLAVDRFTFVAADGDPSRILAAALAQVASGPVAFLVAGSRWAPSVLLDGVTRCSGTSFAWFSAGVSEHNSDLVAWGANDLGPVALRERGIDTSLAAVVVEAELVAEIGGMDTDLGGAEDFDLLIRLLSSGRGVRAGRGVRHTFPERPVRPRSTADPRVWEKVVVSKHLIDWEALEVGLPKRVAGRISVCMPTYEDWSMTRRAVAAVLDSSPDGDVEVVIVDNGSRRSVSSILTALYEDEDRVRVVRSPRNHNFSTGSNLAFAQSSGEFAIFLNNDTVVAPGALAALRDRLSEAPDVVGVQPLLLYPDGTVQTAGTFFNGERIMPWHFLASHPRSDAYAAGVRRFSAVTAAALMMRASDVVQLRGFDPEFQNGLEDVDLCLRGNLLRDDAHFETVLESTVFHHESKSVGRMNSSVLNRGLFDLRWRGRYPASDLPRYTAAGLQALHTTAGTPQAFRLLRTSHPVVVRPPRMVPDGPSAGRPSLRWAIKVDSVFDETTWGVESTDPLVDEIRSVLQQHGQEVVVDQRGTHYRTSDYLDDATVTIQGSVAVSPQPGATSFLWTVGDPVRISPDEAHSYDLVVADGDVSRTAAVPATQSVLTRTGSVADDVTVMLDKAIEIVSSRRGPVA